MNKAIYLPPELLYKVVTSVLGQSIHSICLETGDVGWEMDSFRVLARVCKAFRQMAQEIYAQALEMPTSSDGTVNLDDLIFLIEDRFNLIRSVGLMYRDPDQAGAAKRIMSGRPLLLYGYEVFAISVDLRRRVVMSKSTTQYEKSSAEFDDALWTYLPMTKYIKPQGAADILVAQIKWEISVIDQGEMFIILDEQRTLADDGFCAEREAVTGTKDALEPLKSSSLKAWMASQGELESISSILKRLREIYIKYSAARWRFPLSRLPGVRELSNKLSLIVASPESQQADNQDTQWLPELMDCIRGILLILADNGANEGPLI
ncbi:hypothetical protein AX16_001988 [Volvariella volvacea WC 439]|nr:hypothetical protein AX16_001988 [Volvariella volvacea WC 439]